MHLWATVNISHKIVIPERLSDHELVACVRKMNNIPYQPETIRCRNFKEYDVGTINNDLRNKDWKPVFNTSSPSHAWSHMKFLLKETLNKYINPQKFRTVKFSDKFRFRKLYRPKFLPSENVIAIILYRNFAKHFFRWRYLLNKSVLECFKVIGDQTERE